MAHAVSDIVGRNKDEKDQMSSDEYAEELKDPKYLQAPNEARYNEFDTNEETEFVEVGSKKNVFKHIITCMMHSSIFIFHRE